MRASAVLAAGILALGFALRPAAATTLVELGEREMARSAALIVTGRCLESRSEWIDRELYTLTVVEVEETLKGEAGGRVTVVVPGGVDANRRIPIARTYAGAVHFEPEQEVLLFLERSAVEPGAYQVAGFSQGAYSVVTGPDGVPRAARDLGSIRVVRDQPRRGPRTAIPLAELEARIRGYLAAESRGGGGRP